MHNLNTPWVLWFHSLDENEWTKDTYTKIAEINTLEDFINTYNRFDTFMRGMFFLMRKNIFPQWEDEQNINGGYWSYKIPKQVSDTAWRELSAACVGEYLTKKITDVYNINGISFSPKINNCIIKILNKDAKHNSHEQLTDIIDNLHPSTSQYKVHMENKEEFVSFPTHSNDE